MKALSFVARRAGIYAGLLLLLLLLTFLVYQASPTEPALFVYPNTQHPTDAQLARGNHLLGFDRPLLVQFGDYVWHLLRGDFGHAWQGSSLGSFGKLEPGPPIRPLVSQAVAVSASTVLGGAVLLALLAVPLGLFTARRPRGLLDRIVGSATLLGVTVHPLVMALLLQLFLARRFHLLPQAGYCPLHRGTRSDAAFRYNLAPADCHGPVAWASHLVLPWATFAVFFLAIYTRVIRAQMLDVLRQPYIRAAEARGAGPLRILVRHAFPNAAGSVLAMLAMDIGTAIGVTIFIDAVFGLPGLGRLSVDALGGQLGFDRPIILGVVTVVALAVFVLNLVVDYVQALIDPRVVESGPRRLVRVS